jgi:hypothetical protein
MQEPTLRFVVTCPDCGLESLSELPIAIVANALLTGKSIRLHASCHDQVYWTATYIERELLRKTLGTMKIDARQHVSAAEPSSTPREALLPDSCL